MMLIKLQPYYPTYIRCSGNGSCFAVPNNSKVVSKTVLSEHTFQITRGFACLWSPEGPMLSIRFNWDSGAYKNWMWMEMAVEGRDGADVAICLWRQALVLRVILLLLYSFFISFINILPIVFF